MTQLLLDTSFLYAINDSQDRNHSDSVNFVRSLTDSLILPAPVLPELCYLLHSRLGHLAMRRFLSGLMESDIVLVDLKETDMSRVIELLDQYADARLDFTDTAIVAVAERLNITRVLTFDRRDFALVRPRHCHAFELVP
jgi:predicted nucleic acid-binding protein